MIVSREIRPAFIALSVGVFCTFIFISFVSWRNPSQMRSRVVQFQDKVHQLNIPLISKPSISYEDAIRALYAPLIHPIVADYFMDPTDDEVYWTNQTIWTKPLGKKLCIVDVDTRPLNETGELMNQDFNWQTIEGVSVGMLNHYLYAKIHGYDYKFIHTSQWHNSSRSDVWTKIPALRETLKDYQIVVMVDADAIFRNLNLPYEWLLNRWNFTPETSLMMPLDPEWDVITGDRIYYTNNRYGVVNPNAGFVTAQNLPRTYEMLDDWISCPDNEDEFKGCDDFRDGWPAEQGAFGEHIRYKYNSPTDFLSFDCTDGNGFPSQGSECRGNFVRHFTTGKNELKSGTGDSILQTVLARTHGEILRNSDDVVVERDSMAGVDVGYWERTKPERVIEAERLAAEQASRKAAEEAALEEEKARKKAAEDSLRKAAAKADGEVIEEDEDEENLDEEGDE